jgi:hypothetical protein
MSDRAATDREWSAGIRPPTPRNRLRASSKKAALGEQIAEHAAHLDAATHRLLTDLRVAKRLGGLPKIDEALRKSELSYCKVRALTRVATPENEALLLEDARFTTGGQVERICRKYAAVLRVARPTVEDDIVRRHVTRRDLDDGMVPIEATLHPEEDQLRLGDRRSRAR